LKNLDIEPNEHGHWEYDGFFEEVESAKNWPGLRSHEEFKELPEIEQAIIIQFNRTLARMMAWERQVEKKNAPKPKNPKGR